MLLGALVFSGCVNTAEMAAARDAAAAKVARQAKERTLGLQAFQDGDLELARPYLENSLKANSPDPEVQYHLALLHQAEGRTDKALSMVRGLVGDVDEEGFVSAFRLYTALSISLGRLDEAEDLLKDFTEEDPSNLTRLNLLHRIYLEQGKHAAVMREARGVLKKDETNVGAMHNLASAYLATNRPEQAKYIIQRAVSLDESNGSSHVLSAQIYAALGSETKQLESLEKAHALVPRNGEIQNALAVQYLRVGDHESALALLQVAVRSTPAFVDARINLGNALRGMKEYQAAASAYEESLKLNPRAADAHYNLGILFLQSDVYGQGELERYKRALSEFEMFRDQVGPATSTDVDGMIQETQGLIKLAVERREEALKAAEEAEEEDETEEFNEEDLEDGDSEFEE